MTSAVQSSGSRSTSHHKKNFFFFIFSCLLLLAAFVFREAKAKASSSQLQQKSRCFHDDNDEDGVECVITLVRRDEAFNVRGNEEEEEEADAATLRDAKSLRLRCLGQPPQRLREIVQRIRRHHSRRRSSSLWKSLQHVKVVDCPLLSPLQRLDLIEIASSLTSDLRTLTIEGEEGQKINSFSLEYETFRDGPTRFLHTLRLTSMGLQSLKSGLFCPLTSSLVRLNLSDNAFRSAAEIGLSSDCPLQRLTDLDLSRNDIERLPRHGLSASFAFGLKTVDLSRNKIAMLEENAFDGLGGQLQVLKLSHNRLTAIPADVLGSSPLALTELYLSNNSLSGLPSGLLSRLSNLVVLNLSHNAVSNAWLDARVAVFESLSSLVALDLSHNRLTHIGGAALRGLKALQVLTVANNRIIAVSAFGAGGLLPNLHALVLSYNEIEDLPEAAFEGLSRLNSLAIDHNRIKGLNRWVVE